LKRKNSLTFVSATVLSLLILSAMTSINVLPAEAHKTGYVYQAWAPTPPTIDGSIGTTEWANAATASLTLGAYSATLYVMNDATNLYLAFKINDPDYEHGSGMSSDAILFKFDNDNDGVHPEDGDEYLLLRGDGFHDSYISDSSVWTDEGYGGTSEGSGAMSGSGGYNYFEISHPLNTADNAHDFSLTTGMTVGFNLQYYELGTGFSSKWPGDTGSTMGDIVVASAPPTLSAWCSVAPTIDGTFEATAWQSASWASIAIGWNFIGEISVMNDGENLYLAVRIADSSLSSADRLVVGFDNNNDGIRATGDDGLQLDGSSNFYDTYYPGSIPVKADTVDGGTSDGEGACSGMAGFNYFEFRHPLDSTDDAHDFSLSAGATVGFKLQYIEASGYWGDWPSYNPKSWAHLSIASAPTFNFDVAASPPSRSVAQGQSTTYSVSVNLLSGTTQTVTLSVSGLPSGATISFDPASGNPTFTSTLTVSAAATTPTGSSTLTISGVGGGLTKTTTVTLEVTSAPTFDFSISATPPSQTVVIGSSTTYTVEVTLLSGTAQSVSLSVTGAPSGTSTSLSVGSGNPPFTSTLTVTASASAPAGSYTLTITGTGGGLTRTATVTLVVATAAPSFDFSVSASPSSQSVVQGQSVTFTVTVTLLTGTAQSVTLSISGLPAGATSSFSPASGNPTFTSTLTVATSTSTPTGSSALTLSGVGGGLTRTASATLTVTTATSPTPSPTPSPGGCLVATATYGSELSPEVQFLRGFRDRQVLATFAGSEFMKAFNAWYYSFSPSVANFIANNPTVRAGMKILLYPLVGILHLSASAYATFSFNPELAVCMAGLVASGLIGVVYFSPFALAVLAGLRRTRRVSFSMRNVFPLAYIWAASVGFLILSVLTSSPAAMMASSAIFVLTTIGLTSLSTALKILQRFP